LLEVIRLRRLGKSSRRIARLLSMGRDTLREYLDVLSKAGLLEDPRDALPELGVLSALVRANTASSAPATASSTVDRWRDEIVRLRARGAGPTAIHDHLRLNQPDYAGNFSAIKRLYPRLEQAEDPKAVDVEITVETQAGLIAQADFGYAGSAAANTGSSEPARWAPRSS